MTHTPGPWSCDYGDSAIYCDRGGEVCVMVRGVDDDGRIIGYDEIVANLHLIAAAPELLAALKLLVSEAQAIGWDCSHIKPVIDRAEGRGK